MVSSNYPNYSESVNFVIYRYTNVSCLISRASLALEKAQIRSIIIKLGEQLYTQPIITLVYLFVQGIPFRHNAHVDGNSWQNNHQRRSDQNQISISVIPTAGTFWSQGKVLVIGGQPSITHMSKCESDISLVSLINRIRCYLVIVLSCPIIQPWKAGYDWINVNHR